MNVQEKVLQFFDKTPGIAALLLFGSFAQGRERQESDIDLALLFEPHTIPNPLQLLDWKEDLSASLGRDVDLINLNSASPILSMQVQQYGKPLLILNKRVYDEYLIKFMTDYADLKMARKNIEDQLFKGTYGSS